MQLNHQKDQYDEVLEQLHNTQELLEDYYVQLQNERKRFEKTISSAQKNHDLKIAKLNQKLKDAESRANSAEALAKKFQLDLENIKKSLLWKTTKPLSALKKLTGASNSSRKQLKKQAKILQESGLFDDDWYLSTYPDVSASKINAVEHYLEYGAAEGRQPNTNFDGNWYAKRYPDVAAAEINPLLHYILYGKAEGRAFNQANDTKSKYRNGKLR